MHKITYVLPVYNCQDTLAHCLNSILKVKGEDELIVVNDGSTDRTKEILDYYKKDIDLLITNETRKGGAYSRNLGNSKATGDIISVTDCDEYYKQRPDAIKEFFEEFPDKDVFYSSLHLRDYNNIMEKNNMDAYEWDFQSKCPISHPTVAYRKEVSEKVKYKELSIDTDLYEFFLLDANKEGFKFGGCQTPLMLKVEGGSKRNAKEAKKLKKKLYKEYNIEI